MIEVLGRDAAGEFYRIEVSQGDAPIRAHVPEALMMSDLRPDTRPSHAEAYAWIDRNRRAIERAISDRRASRVPRKPFDLIVLGSQSPDLPTLRHPIKPLP